jgi:hypothetical protein
LQPGVSFFSEHRVLGTMIVVLSLPSISYWILQSLPADTLNELLNSERGSPAVKSLWRITTNLALASPVFFGLSLWALRRMWATISRASRMWLSLFATATGSILLYLLFNLLILLTGNFT